MNLPNDTFIAAFIVFVLAAATGCPRDQAEPPPEEPTVGEEQPGEPPPPDTMDGFEEPPDAGTDAMPGAL